MPTKPEPLNLGVPVVNIPSANAILGRAQALLWVRDWITSGINTTLMTVIFVIITIVIIVIIFIDVNFITVITIVVLFIDVNFIDVAFPGFCNINI